MHWVPIIYQGTIRDFCPITRQNISVDDIICDASDIICDANDIIYDANNRHNKHDLCDSIITYSQ